MKPYVYILFILASVFPVKSTDILYTPLNITAAYEKGTRCTDGSPGREYWQNRADYKIDILFEPSTRLLRGKERIIYFNNSPDSLQKLVFHLFPDLYKRGNSKDINIRPSDLSEGVILEHIEIDGEIVSTSPAEGHLSHHHTGFSLFPENLILPGQQIELTIHWKYEVNQSSHMRTGGVDSTTFFIAYFFPRIAVYDDIDGWNRFDYTGGVEFYNDYGNFDVSISVPDNYIVWATGMLQNPREVLSKKYLDRYIKAQRSKNTIHIIDSTEAGDPGITIKKGRSSWRYKADEVNDFAFALSDHYLWDGTSMISDKETGATVFVDAAYDQSAWDFYSVVDIARRAITHMRDELPGYPFPFPAITIFNGADGMEYPMMVNDISEENMDETIKLTAHEILHSYFPFFVGTNETKYAWMDEGFTSFGDHMIFSALADPDRSRFYYRDGYLDLAGTDIETPLFTISNYLKRPVYWHNSYPKAAAFFVVLHDLLGPEMFKKALHTFYERWERKHPTPWDFFNTFEDVTRMDLKWLIKSWFFEFGYVDLGFDKVSAFVETQNNASTQHYPPEYVLVHNNGGLPVPVHLQVTYDDGSTKIIKKTAHIWKATPGKTNIALPDYQVIKAVQILNPTLIDADTDNNSVSF